MKLLEYLQKNDITQEEFAKELGKSQQLVSRYCTGTLIPPRDTALKIVKITEGAVTLEDLWNLNEQRVKVRRPVIERRKNWIE